MSKRELQSDFERIREEYFSVDQIRHKEFLSDQAAGGSARNVAIRDAEAAFKASWEDYSKVKAEYDKKVLYIDQKANENTQLLKTMMDAFEFQKPTITKKVAENLISSANNANPVYMLGSKLVDGWNRGHQLADLASELELNALDTAVFVTRAWFAEEVGVVGLYKWWAGVDPFTDRDLRDSTRTLEGIFGAVNLIGTAFGILSFGKMLNGKIASRGTQCPGGTCFVGDTQVIIGQHDSAPLFAQLTPIKDENDSTFAVLCLIVGAMAGVALLRDDKRPTAVHKARRMKRGTVPDPLHTETDHAFSNPVDLLQETPAALPNPIDNHSVSPNETANENVARIVAGQEPGIDVSAKQAQQPIVNAGRSVKATTLKAVAIVSLLLSAWFGLNRPAIDSAVMSPAVAEMTADLADQSPRWDSVAIEDTVTGQFVTVGLPDGESQPLPEDTLTEKAPQQDATGVTEWLEYPADDFVPFPIRIAVRDGVIVDVDGKDSNASMKDLISTKYVVGDADGTDVTRLMCRTIDLEMPKPDGSIAELSVIRPLWWLQGTGAAVGGSIDIRLHEIGLSGEATVLAIGPCDVDSRETRLGMSIVTGTIRHRNATVWDLTFDDRTEETLGVTANHPLYSETRHAWIPAGDLQLDEVVRTLNGHSTLTARTQRPNRETVFNLEVHRSHAYHVSGLGVLAHNTGIWTCGTAGSPAKNAKGHWNKHRAEFPELQNAKQYADAAKNFLHNPPTGTLSKIRPKTGERLMYDPKTNTFAAYLSDGTPKTFFRPDVTKHRFPTNLDYFYAQ